MRIQIENLYKNCKICKFPVTAKLQKSKNHIKYLGSEIEEKNIWEIRHNRMKGIGKLRNTSNEEINSILEVNGITSTARNEFDYIFI